MQLPATATIAEASALVRTAEQALASADGTLSVDASLLANFDTSLVAVLLHARRLARQAGRGFEVAGAPAKLAQLASLYGVEELLALSPSSRPAAAAPSGKT